MKRRGGFSYLEIIIAMAIFSILLMAVLPLVTQARRNMVYAREGYAAHLAAQNIMLAVRDSGGDFLAADFEGYAENFEEYGVWIFDGAGGLDDFFTEPPGLPFAPEIFPPLYGSGGIPFFADTQTIVVALWRVMPNGEKHIAGRAVGFI